MHTDQKNKNVSYLQCALYIYNNFKLFVKYARRSPDASNL